MNVTDNRVDKTSEWKKWMKGENTRGITKPGIRVFPVFNQFGEEWIVYEPQSERYMVISKTEYITEWNKRK